MLIRWISVSASLMAMGANPFGARSSVEPRMMIRKKAVRTTSIRSSDVRLKPFGECSPYPLLAKPLAVTSKSALPLAIR